MYDKPVHCDVCYSNIIKGVVRKVDNAHICADCVDKINDAEELDVDGKAHHDAWFKNLTPVSSVKGETENG